ncbi:hypothetical protein [Halobacillus mangrovi]|uniref:Uncharacterized protein n=1 Tax=Halobacillus mangrovi TaxID=402384 RepID=A0A1W5ZXI6_9BACI|nr:hypothetical protein [Halobacillus mangrovi]ARI78038.1 hypothetical protein HM131_14785 [Halobacillus mangrovi]
MMITVSPCFHWIGYHISTGLLQEGFEVVGIDRMDDLLCDHLYMYVGRNSNFQHFYNHIDKEKHLQTGPEEWKVNIEDGLLIIKQGAEESLTKRIEMPELYGEWMDLTALNIHNSDDLCQWVFKNDAVYISDFVKKVCHFFVIGKGHDFQVEQEKSEDEVRRNVDSVWKSHALSLSLGLM